MNKKWTIGLTFSIVSVLILSSLVVMAVPLPFERYGEANIDGSPADDGYTVTAWIDGTEYGDTETEEGDGSYQIFTDGDDGTQEDVKTGGVSGDTIIYRIQDNGNVYIANEIDTFESGEHTADDLNFATGVQPSTEVVINELVVDPDDEGTQYVYIYEPTGDIDLTRWRLEDHDGYSEMLDGLDTQYHPDYGDLLYVDLEAAPLGTDAGHFMLSWDPDGSGVAGNDWVVMDRVEYGGDDLAAIGPPANTIHEQHPGAPGFGEGLIREEMGEDTDNSADDFVIDDETGRPIADPPGPVYNLHVEKDEDAGDVILSWDEEPDADQYNIYHSTNQYDEIDTWDLIGTETETEFIDDGGLGGDNYYIVRAENAAGEGGYSTMGFCYEVFFDAGEGGLHYTSVPNNFDYRGTGELTSFDVIESITGALDERGNLDAVVKWDASIRGYTESTTWDGLGNEWIDEFDIEPGDGIGLRINDDVTWYVTATDAPHPTLEWDDTFYNAGEGGLHYTTVDTTLFDDDETDDELTSFDIIKQITGALDERGNLDAVVKWDASIRGYTESTTWDGLGNEWIDEFDIEPGDGIGLRINDDVEWTRVLQTEPVYD